MLIDQVKDLYLNGYTPNQISTIVNRGSTTIRRWLKILKLYNPKNTIQHNYTNLDFFHEINTEEKAYWLGFIYADGCIYSGKYNNKSVMTMGLNKKDDNHLQKLAKIFNKPISYINQAVRLDINSKQLYNDLVNNGIEERKTYAWTTSVLEYIPENLMNHFIRGYFDGDGSITHLKNNKRACQFRIIGVEDFIIKVQEIMKNCVQNLSETKIFYDDRNFILYYSSHDNIKSIFNWLYKDATVWLERKRDKFEKIMKILNNEIEFKDRIEHYKGVYKCSKNIWRSYINGQYIKNCKSESDAAYYHDIEQVRLRGEEAKRYMNFPSQYDQFIKWIEEGY